MNYKPPPYGLQFKKQYLFMHNVVGDHSLDYVIATIIGDFPLSFSEAILDHGGLNYEIILIMVLVVYIMH
jgi:hypothetical protein